VFTFVTPVGMGSIDIFAIITIIVKSPITVITILLSTQTLQKPKILN